MQNKLIQHAVENKEQITETAISLPQPVTVVFFLFLIIPSIIYIFFVIKSIMYASKMIKTKKSNKKTLRFYAFVNITNIVTNYILIPSYTKNLNNTLLLTVIAISSMYVCLKILIYYNSNLIEK